MNEYAIVELYQEMIASIQKIRNSNHNLDDKQNLSLERLEYVAEELKARADEHGFGDKLYPKNDIIVDASDDFQQIAQSFELDASDTIEVLKAFRKLREQETAGKKELWDCLKTLEKYYKANVATIDHITVCSKMKGQYEEIFGKEIKDKDTLALAYQNAAELAIEEEISNLVKNKGVVSTDRLHNAFVKALKGEKTWVLAGEMADAAIVQLKYDFKEIELGDRKIGYLDFNKGKVQVSLKIALAKPITASQQKKIFNGFAQSFTTVGRNTFSINKISGNKGVSSTLFTQGQKIPLFRGGVTAVCKLDMGKFDWGKLVHAEPGGISPAALRFQLAGHPGKVVLWLASMLSDDVSYLLNNAKVDLAGSLGWNVSVDWTKVQQKINWKKQQSKKTTATSTVDDIDAPSLEKDKKQLQKIQQKTDDLAKHSDDLAKKLNNAVDKADLKGLKEEAKKLQQIADANLDMLENHKWADQGLKDKAGKILNDAAEMVYDKLKGPITKLSKALKYAKPLAKLIPGVNVILTVIEVATFIYDMVTWFNSIEASSWEDYFIAAGKAFKNSFIGRAAQSLDHYMSGH